MVERIEDGAKDADLILITTPVRATEKILEQISQMSLKETVIISDAGSTKSSVVDRAKKLAVQRGHLYWWTPYGWFA